MTVKEASELGRTRFQKYSPAAHSLANNTAQTGVMRLPELNVLLRGGKSMSNEDLVLDYIRENGGITQRQAALELNVWRLASVVCRLRKKGFPVEREMMNGENGAKFARYYLA